MRTTRAATDEIFAEDCVFYDPEESIARCSASSALIAKEDCVVRFATAIVTDALTSIGIFEARIVDHTLITP
jgi:hypothetical protein